MRRFTRLLLAMTLAGISFTMFVPGQSVHAQTTQTKTFWPEADTTVNAQGPANNYGKSTILASNSNPIQQSFVRFKVSGMVGTVVSATFRLYITAGAARNSASVRRTSSITWNEIGVTYNTRPALTGAELGRFTNIPVGRWVHIPVKAVVTGNGTYSFAVTQAAGTLIRYASREYTDKKYIPQLAVSTQTTPAIWKPALRTSWQWQLSGAPIDQSVNAQMYDIDLFDNSASVVQSLHSKGRKVVCYFSAGSWEDWRPDAARFPAAVKGRGLDGWPGEKWLDIRQIATLGPIMEARMDLCKSKGFDAIEPDNIDGYSNNSGFPLTYQDQIKYNIFLANAAHKRGLSIALKNDLDQVRDLLPYFDFAINEECFAYDECNLLQPFIAAGKAVFNVEYELSTSEFCSQANSLNFNSLLKRLDLDAYRVACR